MDVAVTPDGYSAYVINAVGKSVSLVDTRTNGVVRHLDLEGTPNSIAIGPDGNAYVAGLVANRVWMMNAAHAAVGVAFSVDRPVHIAISPDGTLLYVVKALSPDLAVWDLGTRTQLAAIRSPGWGAVTVSPDGRLLFVTGSHRLTVIDAPSGGVAGIIPLDGGPQGVAIDASGQVACVTNMSGTTAAVIDLATSTPRAQVDVGAFSWGVAISRNGRVAYVTLPFEATVAAIDLAAGRLLRSIRTGKGPRGIALHPKRPVAYVANSSDDTVSVIDLGTDDGPGDRPAAPAG